MSLATSPNRTQYAKGGLPRHWEQVCLSDVAEQCLGKMLDSKKTKGTPHPYLRNPNVKWFKIDVSDLQEMPFQEHELERFAVRSGDVLICEGGEAGRAAIWEHSRTDVKFQKAIHRVRCGPKLFNRYFVHCLMADYQSERLADYYTGTTIKHLTGQDLATYEFPLPPLVEQRRIAAILDAAEALRAKRRAALAKLGTLTQSIFLGMFGDPESNPRNFPRKTLGEIIEFVGGSQPPKDTFTQQPSADTIRLVQIRDFRTDAFKTYIPRNLARRFFEEDDVMIGRYGPPVFQIFRGLSGSYNVALMKAVPKGDVSKDFVFNLLQSPRLHGFVVSRSERTAGQSGVNLDLLENYPAYLPPKALQDAFSARSRTVDKLKNAAQRQAAKFEAMFSALQHRAFRGEL